MEFLCIYIIIGALYSAYINMLIIQETLSTNDQEFIETFRSKSIKILTLFIVGLFWIIIMPLRIVSIKLRG